jgi:hypothetical protein
MANLNQINEPRIENKIKGEIISPSQQIDKVSTEMELQILILNHTLIIFSVCFSLVL